jgi:hypothetical protein
LGQRSCIFYRGDPPNPNKADAYRLRGDAYQKIGEKDKRDADFAKAKKLGDKP